MVKIVDLDEHTVVVDIDRGTKIRVERSSLALEATKRSTGEKK